MIWKGKISSGSLSMDVELIITTDPYNGLKSFNGQGTSTMLWPGTELNEVYETNIGTLLIGLEITSPRSDGYRYSIKGLSAAGPLLLL